MKYSSEAGGAGVQTADGGGGEHSALQTLRPVMTCQVDGQDHRENSQYIDYDPPF